MKAEYSKKECKNCEYPMDSCHKFCTNCGQKDLEKKLSIKDFFEEFLANFYAFDSKVITSLRYLYTKPGVMAYEFVNGKRLKFVNPFRLLLSLAILLGLFMKFVTFVEEIKGDNLVKNKIEQEATDSDHVKLVSGLANIKVNIKKTDTIWFNIEKEVFYTKGHIPKEHEVKNIIKKIRLFINYSNDYPKDTFDDFVLKSKFKNNFINKYLFERAQILKSSNLRNLNPDVLIQNFIKSSLPFYLFLFIPFFAVLFYLFFYKTGFNFTENLIFTFYLFSNYIFSFIILIFIELFTLKISNFIIIFLIFYNWIYLYKSLKNFYAIKKSIIRIKFVILSFLMSMLLFLSILLIVIISFLMS